MKLLRGKQLLKNEVIPGLVTEPIITANVEQISDVTTMATTDENAVGGFISSQVAPDVKSHSAVPIMFANHWESLAKHVHLKGLIDTTVIVCKGTSVNQPVTALIGENVWRSLGRVWKLTWFLDGQVITMCIIETRAVHKLLGNFWATFLIPGNF